MTQTMRVIKRDAAGHEVITYEGQVVERGETWVCLKAPFLLESRDLGYVVLEHGDWFTEWFYMDRWYNIFKVESQHDEQLKGYYCNLTRPAEIMPDQVASDDLELDLFVKPDGTWLLLDQDEYEALDLEDGERHAVEDALSELKQMIIARHAPFDILS